MFYTRILTAIVLAICFVSLLFFSNEGLFIIFIGLILTISLKEWLSLIRIRENIVRLILFIFILTMIFFTGLSNFYLIDHYQFFLIKYLFLSSLILWFFIFFMIIFFSYEKKLSLLSSKYFSIFSSLIVLFSAWQGFLYLFNQDSGHYLFLFLIVIVSSSDIGAYLTGKIFGRHKLAKKISPGKTWEGFIGGLVLSQFFSHIFLSFYSKNLSIFYDFNIFSLILFIAIISVMGDLYISLLKRSCGEKDTGDLLPGHGGILDRIDGVIPALTFYPSILFFING